MKKLSLTLLMLLAALANYANSQTIVNTTGCKYWIATDGGWFTVDPNTSVYLG